MKYLIPYLQDDQKAADDLRHLDPRAHLNRKLRFGEGDTVAPRS